MRVRAFTPKTGTGELWQPHRRNPTSRHQVWDGVARRVCSATRARGRARRQPALTALSPTPPPPPPTRTALAAKAAAVPVIHTTGHADRPPPTTFPSAAAGYLVVCWPAAARDPQSTSTVESDLSCVPHARVSETIVAACYFPFSRVSRRPFSRFSARRLRARIDRSPPTLMLHGRSLRPSAIASRPLFCRRPLEKMVMFAPPESGVARSILSKRRHTDRPFRFRCARVLCLLDLGPAAIQPFFPLDDNTSSDVFTLPAYYYTHCAVVR